MPLSASTQQLIETALNDKVASDQADLDVTHKQDVVNQAQEDLTMAVQTSAQAHTQTTADANAALAAVAQELGLSIPTPTSTMRVTREMMAAAPSHIQHMLLDPLVTKAVGLGIPWLSIIQTLINGGLPALKTWILNWITNNILNPGGGGSNTITLGMKA